MDRANAIAARNGVWMRDVVPAPGPELREPMIGRGGLAPIAGGSPEADAAGAAAIPAGASAGAGPSRLGVAPRLSDLARTRWVGGAPKMAVDTRAVRARCGWSPTGTRATSCSVS